MRQLRGYQKPITALVASPDGKRLYSLAQGQSMIWEWDLAEGCVTHKFRQQHHQPVTSMVITPSGQHLLSAGRYDNVVRWNLADNAGIVLPMQQRTARPDNITQRPSLAVDPLGRFVVAPLFSWYDHARGFQMWDVTTGERVLRRCGLPEIQFRFAFSPGGGLLAMASHYVVRLWDFDASRSLYEKRQDHQVTGLFFRRDGKILAVIGNRSIYLRDASNGELIRTLTSHDYEITGAAYSPDGKFLATVALDGAIVLRDSSTHEVVGQRNLDLGGLYSLSWRADSSGLFIGANKVIVDCELPELLVIEQTSRPHGEPLTLTGHSRKVELVAYSPDGSTLASAQRSRARLWDMSGGAGQAKEKATFEPRWGTPRNISWSPDGKLLAFSYYNEAIVVDAETRKRVGNLPHSAERIQHLTFTPSGNLVLACGTGSQIRFVLYDSTKRQTVAETARIPLSYNLYIGVRTFAQDQRLYLVTTPHTVSRWSPKQGTLSVVVDQRNAQVSGFDVSSDERLLVTLGGNSAHVWPLSPEKKRLELKHPLGCSDAAFLPGERLITACYDGLVRLWDLTGGAELLALDLGMGKIYTLAVAPDHMTFAAGVEKKKSIVLMDVPE